MNYIYNRAIFTAIKKKKKNNYFYNSQWSMFKYDFVLNFFII